MLLLLLLLLMLLLLLLLLVRQHHVERVERRVRQARCTERIQRERERVHAAELSNMFGEHEEARELHLIRSLHFLECKGRHETLREQRCFDWECFFRSRAFPCEHHTARSPLTSHGCATDLLMLLLLLLLLLAFATCV